MKNPCDLVVTLELGAKRRVVTAREIVSELGDPGLAGRLIALVLSASPAHGERRGEGGSEGQVATDLTQNAYQEISGMRWRSGSGEGAGGARESEPASPHDDIERVAAHLASALRDGKSIAYFRTVARAVPREVIRDALTRALDAQSVRRSRAALFAHLIRPHLSRSLTNHSSP